MSKNILNEKQLAELIYPIFAFENPLLLNRNYENTISTIPLDICLLINSYLNMYNDGNHLEDINLIINVENYLKSPELWLEKFADNMSETFSKLKNEYTVDFKLGYIDIIYKTDELDILKKLNPIVLSQLVDMRNWILSTKLKEKSMSDLKEFNKSEAFIKPFILKR